MSVFRCDYLRGALSTETSFCSVWPSSYQSICSSDFLLWLSVQQSVCLSVCLFLGLSILIPRIHREMMRFRVLSAQTPCFTACRSIRLSFFYPCVCVRDSNNQTLTRWQTDSDGPTFWQWRPLTQTLFNFASFIDSPSNSSFIAFLDPFASSHICHPREFAIGILFNLQKYCSFLFRTFYSFDVEKIDNHRWIMRQ